MKIRQGNHLLPVLRRVQNTREGWCQKRLERISVLAESFGNISAAHSDTSAHHFSLSFFQQNLEAR